MTKSEAKIQQEIVVFFRNTYQRKGVEKGIIFSVPNEREGVVIMKKLKQTGLTSGVSDLIVLLENRALFVEVKTETGKQSANQKKFQSQIEKLGFEYFLVRNLENFKEIL